MNFVDKKTGEALSPMVKWFSPYGEIKEKPLEVASWLELYEFSIKLWELAISIENDKVKYKKDRNTCIGLIVLLLVVSGAIFVLHLNP